MLQILARNWRWILLRGVVATLFGLFTLLNPGLALAGLILLFGAYALTDGVLMLAAALVNRRSEPLRGALLTGGILGTVTGILTFTWPEITTLALLAIVALWAIAVGLAETVAAIQLRRQLVDEWMLVIAGVASVAFGAFLVVRPSAGALVVMLWIGAYAVFEGTLLVALALRLRSWGRQLSEAIPSPIGPGAARP